MCYVQNNDDTQSGIRTYNNTWYSLPYSPYGQRTEKIEKFLQYYNKHLAEKLKGISNLAIGNEEIADFFK